MHTNERYYPILDAMTCKQAYLASLLCLLGACHSVPGPCDSEASVRIAFTADGLPAYEGQALLHNSCGFGTFCHASLAVGTVRFGTPRGYDLDVSPASYGTNVGDTERLARASRVVDENRGSIHHQVETGQMPPGEKGAELLASANRPIYFDATGSPLPELNTDEGLEILRNWLQCGSPLIERTAERADGQPSVVGDVVATGCRTSESCTFGSRSRCQAGSCVLCESDDDCTHLSGTPVCSEIGCVAPLEPTWDAIYEQMVVPSCALTFCHGSSFEANLDLRGLEAGYDALAQTSSSEDCADLGLPMVTPGRPDQSLFYLKLFAMDEEERSICGFSMPYAEPLLPDQWLEAVDAWIAAGAAGPQ